MRTVGKGPSAPQRLRNPCRGYDVEGRDIEPATVANARANGARGITVRCAYNHEALLPFERLRPSEYLLDVALRCHCTRCGRRRLETYPDWSGGCRCGARSGRVATEP